MTTPARPDDFFRTALRSMAPLLVWAAHFACCYALVAFGCVAWGPHAPLRVLLLAASALALGAIVAHGVWAWRRRGSPLATPVACWSAVLALLGVSWTTLPVLVLPVCEFD